MIRLDYSGLEEATDAIHKMNLGVGKNITKLVKKLTEDVVGEMRERVPTWKGDLKSSISAEYTKRGDTAYGTAQATSNHAGPIELGTGTHGPRGRRYFPNPANLEEWALDHGFRSGYHAAYMIYLNGGTKATEFAKQSFIKVARDNLGRAADQFLKDLEN